MTKEIIDNISKMYPYNEFIYLETLKSNNPNQFQEALINNKYLMELLLTKGMYIKLDFSYNVVMTIINYIENNNIKYSSSCLFDILHTSLSDKKLQVRFLKENINSSFKSKMLKVFDKDVVGEYINHNSLYINNKDLYDVLMYKDVLINPNLYQTKSFFNKCIIKKNLYETRLELARLSNSINISYFEKLLLKEETKLLSLYNKELDIIDYNESNTLLINYLNENNNDTKKIILEIVIDYLFQDSTHNVYLNLIELIDYSLNNNLFSKERLTFYKDLLSIYKSNSSNILDFFYKYKDKYNSSYFYDDLRLLKNDSYNNLKDSCLKIDNIDNLKNKDLSNKYNIDIYELNGEPFNMLVSCTYKIPNGYSDSPRNCYTYIGRQNMQVIYQQSYIYGYCNFDINNIMHVYEDDSYSLNLEVNTTSYINRIRNKEELLNTNYRSEIQIKNNKIKDKVYEQIMPSYIICFDELNEKSIMASRKLNIPIIIINKKKYNILNDKNPLINYEEEYTLLSYMNSSASNKRDNRIV